MARKKSMPSVSARGAGVQLDETPWSEGFNGPAVFAGMAEQLRLTYWREVDRLASVYRDRILAGEFSGWDDEKQEPEYFRLERDLVRHPSIQAVSGALLVVGLSRWGAENSPSKSVQLSEACTIKRSAAECLTHDVLHVAVERGWVRRVYRNGTEYPVARQQRARALRVA